MTIVKSARELFPCLRRFNQPTDLVKYRAEEKSRHACKIGDVIKGSDFTRVSRDGIGQSEKLRDIQYHVWNNIRVNLQSVRYILIVMPTKHPKAGFLLRAFKM